MVFRLVLFACLAGSLLAAEGLHPRALRCEYLANPLGLDDPAPRLSWRVEGTTRGQRQVAYRLLAASSPEGLQAGRGDLWDSGRVVSSRTSGLAYAGRPLAARQQVYWKVCVWDSTGASRWSEPARWEMGPLVPTDWQARFISFRDPAPLHRDPATLFLPPARQFRKTFDLGSGPVRRAVLRGTALGICEFHLNGQRVGDAWFAPGWTDYRERARCHSHEVTALLRPGPNALGAWLAEGWFSGYLGLGAFTVTGTEGTGRATYGKTPALLAQLEIEYADGRRVCVGTDASWKVSGEGPIREADLLMGESYDARREQAGWATAEFDDRDWEAALPAEENGPVPASFVQFENPALPSAPPAKRSRAVDLAFRPPRQLEGAVGVPVRVIEELRPVAVTSPTPGVHLFDLGQNIAGVVRLRVRGAAGATVRLRHGEMLHPDGTLMTENLRRARATDQYILRGDPAGETYTPRFTFHGFQYVEVTGLPGPPADDTITGLVLHSDTPLASGFECSDPLVNRLFRNIVWTQRANFLDLPTDCPQRDERLGWTGDAQVFARCATLNADVAAFFTQWLRELRGAQRPSGAFPDFAPFPHQTAWDFSPGWTDAGIIVPWTLWQAYGDLRLLARSWPAMTRFMAWRDRASREDLGVAHGNSWGDWLALGGATPLEYIDTIYLARTHALMAEMAVALGRHREAARFRQRFAAVRTAFQRRYLRPDGLLRLETQTAYALALEAGLLPAALEPAAGAELARLVRAKSGPADSGLGTGFLGTRPLLPRLTRAGRHDLALELIQSRKFPSWGFEIENGATTIWERWDSFTKAGGFGGPQNAQMNSFSHYAFGAVGEWLLRDLAGLDTDGPGFERLQFRVPAPVPPSAQNPEPIHWVKAHHDSIRGRIECAWRHEPGRSSAQFTIPANTTATVRLPVHEAAGIREGGRPLREAPGVRLLRRDGTSTLMRLHSGRYDFAWPSPASGVDAPLGR